jgi:NAD(P)-dependent dehydrogenase (short-subunit alcohol dehydrogenase family)
MDLRGKTAVVTGGNSGIGFVTARELARGGARVTLACRNVGKAGAAAAEIARAAGNGSVGVVRLAFGDARHIAGGDVVLGLDTRRDGDVRVVLQLVGDGLHQRRREITVVLGRRRHQRDGVHRDIGGVDGRLRVGVRRRQRGDGRAHLVDVVPQRAGATTHTGCDGGDGRDDEAEDAELAQRLLLAGRRGRGGRDSCCCGGGVRGMHDPGQQVVDDPVTCRVDGGRHLLDRTLDLGCGGLEPLGQALLHPGSDLRDLRAHLRGRDGGSGLGGRLRGRDRLLELGDGLLPQIRGGVAGVRPGAVTGLDAHLHSRMHALGCLLPVESRHGHSSAR